MSLIPQASQESMLSAVPSTITPAMDVASATFDFLDLKAQFATIRQEVMEAIVRVMESQRFILGEEVRLFENEVGSMLGAKHSVSCASGSDALVLALMASDIGPGDEVITTPFSFVATSGSIARVGATPVFVDIDPGTFNMDPQSIEAAITPKTRAIMPVHLFGLPADLAPIQSVAKAHHLVLIEDAAQAIGSRYQGRHVGTIGDFGCFSFFPSKNLGGAGDGGLVTTENDAFADRLRLLRVHGSKKKYHHEILGTNSRLDALQAAILRAKLRHLDEWTVGRQQRAERYRLLFHEAGLESHAKLPVEPSSEFHHVYNQFSIRSVQRDDLRHFMQRAGIPTEVYYPLCLHLQPAFSYLGYQAGQFPQSELASSQVLSLPIYAELTEVQQLAVVQAIADFYDGKLN